MWYVLCIFIGAFFGGACMVLCVAAHDRDAGIEQKTEFKKELLECNKRLCAMCKLAAYGVTTPKCEECKWRLPEDEKDKTTRTKKKKSK